MSDAMEIGYRGYAIRFNENSEEWRCWALDIGGEKLATVKRKIDKIVAASRKLNEAQTAIYLDYQGRVQQVRVMSFAQPRKEGAEPAEAWTLTSGQERYYSHAEHKNVYRAIEERKKLALERLFADTPENRDIVSELNRMDAEIKQLGDRRKQKAATLVTFGSTFNLTTENDDADAA